MTADRARRHRSRSTLTSIVSLGLAWLLPVVVLLFLFPHAERTERRATSPPVPATVVIGSRSDHHRVGVTASLTFSRTVSATYGYEGTVTGLYDDLVAANGTPVLDIDGAPVVMIVGETPLYRDLTSGDRGEDVLTAAHFLQELGFLDATAVDGHFGPAMSRAACAYQAEVRGGTGPCDGRFHRRWVVYVPPDVRSLTPPDVELGARVHAGDALTTSVPEVTGIEFVPETDGMSTTPLAGERVVVRAPSGAQFEIADFTPPFPEELADFIRSNGIPSVHETAGTTAHHPGFSVARAVPHAVGTVPTVSLYVAADGTTCIFEDAQPSPRPIEVEVSEVVGELGVLGVDPDLVGTSVVRDPWSLETSVRALC